jgi:phosphoribosylformimino-5-aminoimidazole carboxamide ribotide isomerase
MRVIPVIDLMGGQVVRGVAGRRSEYRPVVSRIAADARPATVARAFVEQFGFETAYVADLEAIMRGQADVAGWQQIAAAGLAIWLDAGIGDLGSAERATQQLDRAGVAARLVIGMESLESADQLTRIGQRCGENPPLFSLDMQGGLLVTQIASWKKSAPLEIVEQALSAGIRDIIVLDLADVGTGSGTRTLDLCREIRGKSGVRTLIAGGGVRGPADLAALADAGCDAALVASALHDGRLTVEEIGEARRLSH